MQGINNSIYPTTLTSSVGCELAKILVHLFAMHFAYLNILVMSMRSRAIICALSMVLLINESMQWFYQDIIFSKLYTMLFLNFFVKVFWYICMYLLYTFLY